MKKRILSLVLAAFLLLGMAPAAMAAGTVPRDGIQLYSLRRGSWDEYNGLQESFAAAWSTQASESRTFATAARFCFVGWGDAEIAATEEPYVVDKNITIDFNDSNIPEGDKKFKSVTVNANFKVVEGGLLDFGTIRPKLPSLDGYDEYHAEVTFTAPIILEGGQLKISQTYSTYDRTADKYTFTNAENAIVVNDGAELLINYNVDISSTADGVAPITLNGGSLVISKDSKNVSSITSTNAPAIEIGEGSSVEINGGKITANDVPAITVANGATLIIPADSTATVTTNATDGKAIDLAAGSIVKAGDATVTVGSAEGDNYVDNNGKIVLASGSVQVGGQTIQLPNGGTVTPADGEGGTTVINPNVEGVTLDKNALTLNPSQTAQLTATVSPDNADKTVTWTSSNEAVATVDQSGNVTAMGVGTATITATAGEKTATCTVTVAYPYIPVPPVAPTQPTKPAEPDQPDEPDTPVIPGGLPFVDVSANDWFYDSVVYVYAQGIMTGSTTTSFAPNDAMTRAMVWTVLGRMSGEDVEGGTPWYALAQSWAVSSNVSDGTGPNDSITREQLVTMLYRQAGSPEVGVSELALLGRFTDGENVSAWAEEAMAWAVSQGILTGDGGALNPQATATRAQVATILARYCENSEK